MKVAQVRKTSVAAGARKVLIRLFLNSVGALLLVVALAGPAPAQAQENLSLGEMVVTASRIPEPERETTSAVVVIRRDDIERMNVQFVPDVLRQVADLNVTQRGGPGREATVMLRGGSANEVLVLIDGVKVNSTTLGQFDFAGITVEDIERIEIVKGPQSTMYGSEAMAGVINIITRKGAPGARAELSYEAGANDTTHPSFTLSGGFGAYDYRVTGSYLDTEGISAAKSGSERDGYRNTTFSGKFGMAATRNLSIEVSGRYREDRAEIDDFDLFSLIPVDDPNYAQEGKQYVFSTKGTLLLWNKWEQTLTLSTVREELRYTDPDPVPSFHNTEYVSRIDTADWQHNFYLAKGYSITVGGEHRIEKGEHKDDFDEQIDNSALYFNTRRKSDNLTMTLGARQDMHETFGDKLTWRAGILEEAGGDMRFRASYGTGFRAPTLNELFDSVFGNPDLKPEESESWEVGVEQDYTKNMTLSVTYFEQRYWQLIQWVPPAWKPQNVARAKIKGFETGATYRLSNVFTLRAAYTNLDTEDRSDGSRLPLRPKDKVNLGAGYSGGRLSLHADYTYVGKRNDPGVSRNLAPYNLVNLSGDLRFTKYMNLFARVENLLNEDYEEAGGYGTPGASFYGGVKIIF